MNKVTSKKMINVGLYDYVNPEHQRGMTRLLNKAVKILTEKGNVFNLDQDDLFVKICPIIIRIYYKVKRTNLDVNDIINSYIDFRNSINEDHIDYVEMKLIGVDIEAIIVLKFCEEYIKELKNEHVEM